MKVKEIKKDSKKTNVFLVTLEPNYVEKLLGIKEVTKKYKKTGATYTFGSGNVYIRQDGSSLGNNHYIGDAIDNWLNKW